MRHNSFHWHVEEIASPGNRLYDALVFVTERLANLEKALRQRVIGYERIGPHRADQFILGDKPAGTLNNVTQCLERLGAESHLLRFEIKARLLQVKSKPFDPVHRQGSGRNWGKSLAHRRVFHPLTSREV